MSSALISNRRIFLFTILLLLVLPKLDATDISTQRCSSDWTVSADFLAWFASEEVSSIWADVITVGDNTSSWEALSFNFKWDYGFRIGAGYGFLCDQWDTQLYWTRYCTDAKHTISHNPDATITPEFFAAFLSGDTPQSMSIKWDLSLDMFDWELGRRYCVSRGLSLRPFLGVKGGWINQSIHGQYYNLKIKGVQTSESASEHLKNNFWGIGTVGGINTKWKVCNFWFDFFGDFSTATMWGRWSCNDEYNNMASQTSSVNMKNSTLGALMFRGFMGIEWNISFNEAKSHFSTKLGYEMQLWFNQLRLATFQLQRLHGDLSLQGVTLNCRFDF